MMDESENQRIRQEYERLSHLASDALREEDQRRAVYLVIIDQHNAFLRDAEAALKKPRDAWEPPSVSVEELKAGRLRLETEMDNDKRLLAEAGERYEALQANADAYAAAHRDVLPIYVPRVANAEYKR